MPDTPKPLHEPTAQALVASQDAELSRLRDVLRQIESELRWFRPFGGAGPARAWRLAAQEVGDAR